MTPVLPGRGVQAAAGGADIPSTMMVSTPASTHDRNPAAEARVAAWVRRWRDTTLPVLDSTALDLELWRAQEDAADARHLAEAFGNDPLMCLKVLSHVARKRARPDGAGAETLTEALVLFGISPFFRDFGPQPTVQAHLDGQPAALGGLLQVLQRSRRAARFALGFAVHRMDHDAAVIHEAALLHDFAEMLLWCHEPALALRLQAMQQAQPGLRSARAQQEVLGFELPDLQHALMLAWRLPPLLVHISDDHHTMDPQVRNVLLAIRLARHTAQGWDNPAIPDDVRDIAALLNLAEGPTRTLLLDLDDA